jgi:ribonuclease G
MLKEMYISSSPHETKVAVLEDDQLVEVYFERDTDVGLVGGIYKGRVSRVLPGMQSAFVDIGLGRDAFLYVSDFYEDQEEYDKVFEEAEARATKFTAQQAAATAPPPPPAPLAVTEAPPPAHMEVASLPAAPILEPPPIAATIAPTAAPPVPATGHSDSRESGERRPFDSRRGRRRRHRGRPEFGERHHGLRSFPPHREDAPPAESHAFEILPGESLAKYGHGASAPPDEVEAGLPQGVPPENSGVDGAWSEETTFPDVAAGGVAEPVEDYAPDANVDEGSVEASTEPAPVVEPAVVEPAVVAETAPEPPPAAASAVVTEATVTFSPGAIQNIVSSAAAQGLHPEIAELSALVSTAPVQAPPEEPAPAVEKSTEPAQLAVPLEPAAEVSASPSAIEEAEPQEAAPSTETESVHKSPSEAMESFGIEVEEEGEDVEGEELEEGEELAEIAETELLAEASEGELDDEGELPAEVSAGTGGEGQRVAQEAAAGEPSISGAPGAPGDRTYTLREPHQRPRVAPRRRRGRRGPGGGGQRRPDNRRESQRPGNHQPVQIAEVLKEGQEILVQIAKEPLGTKGARITSHVALPGRYLVYMPTIEHIGVSRKIASEEERLRLRNIILENKGPLTGGFIVRTAGQGRSEDEFKADLKFLSTLWSEIRSKFERMKAPALIHRDLDLVQRLLRDLLTPDFKCVRVDNEIDFERVLDFVNRCQPALIGKVKLYSRDTPLFEEFGVQTELDKALKPKVWLKSGGYIVINQTEALVAVDVNTGKYVGKTNRLEDTIVKTNVDAVNEIVRQVRLRDLGGIIVIDFIDMDERKNRAKVVQALEEALRADRAPTKVISFHDFGLVAVTRKRVKQSLERTLCEPCSYCSASGWVKSVNTVCNEILAEARKMAKGIDGNVITLRVSPEVAKALKSREGGLVSELESLTKKDVIIKGDPMVHQERFEIY